MNRSAFLVFIVAFLFCICLATPSEVRFRSVTNEANHPLPTAPVVETQGNHVRVLQAVDSVANRQAYQNVVLTPNASRIPTQPEFQAIYNEGSEPVYFSFLQSCVFILNDLKHDAGRKAEYDELAVKLRALPQRFRTMRPQDGTVSPIRIVRRDRNDMKQYLNGLNDFLVTLPQTAARGQAFAYNAFLVRELERISVRAQPQSAFAKY